MFRLFPWRVGALNACGAFNLPPCHGNSLGSQHARPTGSAEVGGKKRRVTPLGIWFGRAGRRTRLFSTLKELGYGGLCPHPLRKLSFLRTFHCCRAFERTLRRGSIGGASRYHNGAAPSPRTLLTLETYPGGQAPTTGAQLASPKRGSDCVQAQPAQMFSTNFNRS